MNEILSWLSGGDLRSDGLADQAAEFILGNPQLVDELFEGLSSENPVIRGRTADALEKVARQEPGLFINRVSELVKLAKNEDVQMVKMHLAMLFGHLVACKQKIDEITEILLHLLKDEGAFTRSWTITSLAIIGKVYPDRRELAYESISRLGNDQSIAIQTRARKALEVLEGAKKRFPKGWIKSVHLGDI
jgi:HEAT repeat protein